MNEQNIDEVMPLFAPVYDSAFLEKDRKLSEAIVAQAYNEETNRLADKILLEDQGNYNAWFIKKKYVLAQGSDPKLVQRQLRFVDICLSQKAKGFQVWQQKRFLTELGCDWQKEIDNTEKILCTKDHKNYHAWSFRVWLTGFAGIHSKQLSFAEKMIKKDPFNNSAWSHLHFLLNHLVKASEDQQFRRSLIETYVTFCLKSLKEYKSNRAAWNFLRGLFPSIKIKAFSSQNSINKRLISSYDNFREIEQLCKTEWNEFKTLESKGQETVVIEREIFATLVHIYSQKQETLQFARNICQQLTVKDPLRAHYWSWVEVNL